MRYRYQAIDAQKQEVSGILTAEAEREAARQLQRRGLTPLSLTSVGAKTRTTGGKPKQRDIIRLARWCRSNGV
ncbi:MAG: hypothetical protein B6247_31680 [Candidatus Parabeggiatoa sp. nov. 2]|nr:MAG: hypothetical protein B6247_31680 [Beggiatoa sp. 4572_84]